MNAEFSTLEIQKGHRALLTIKLPFNLDQEEKERDFTGLGATAQLAFEDLIYLLKSDSLFTE